jgi:formate-dependent phosphoribosylglycinamide formyltransferase (GAR transformylase)
MPVAAIVAPYLLPATMRFVRAAARLADVRLVVVTQEPADGLPDGLGHWRVEDALDAGQLAAAVQGIGARLGHVERIFAPLEQLQVPLGQVREALGIPGMDAATAHNFRDKSRMKEVLRAAGVPCARHRLVVSAGDAFDFAGEAGYPVVAKPPAGAGAKGTFRLAGPEALQAWLDAVTPSPQQPALLEEFLTGQEHSFDSVTLDGQVVWHSISHYLPAPLEVLRNAWMQWAVLLPRDIAGPEYEGIRQAGPAALAALGLRAGLTHMEWFRRPDGSVAVSEVAARPPGAQITTMLSYAHDRDFYEAWARLMLLDAFDPPERRWAVGAAFLRAQSPGKVTAVRGVDDLQREVGELVVEARLPEPGQPTADGYEGEGYAIVRHADTAVVADALKRLVSDLRVEVS